MRESTREWTHRELLVNYLKYLALGLGAFAALAAILAWFTSWDFALFLSSFGSLAMFLGIPRGYSSLCARATVAPGSRPGAELGWLPWLSAVAPAALGAAAASQFPDTSIAVVSLAVAGLGFSWSIYAGCRAISDA